MGSKRADNDDRKSRLSRRGFLKGFGASAGAAGAVVLDPAKAIGAVTGDGASAGATTTATSPAFFGRIFQLPPFAEPTPQVQAALMEMGKPGGLLDANDALDRGPVALIVDPSLNTVNRDNQFHTAGTTFFGQFIDHDLTFDTTSTLGVPKPPEQSPNTRTPGFDLDSVYGGGPTVSPALYDPADRAKFRVENGGLFEDLPRSADGQAIIGDPRNDENLMIAGIHVAFLLFHNRVVDRLRSQGVPETRVFTDAQRLVRWHYQWIVLWEILPQFIGRPLVEQMLQLGRRFYRPAAGQQFIPVEFQGAAYRFGHSMVRPSYRANLAGNPDGSAFFGMIFDPAGEGQADPVDLRGGARARRRFIGWQTFFDFGLLDPNGVTPALKPNKRIDTKLSTALFHLPLQTIPDGAPPTALPQRNLLRHLTWELPSGQAIAEFMREPALGPSEFPELRSFGVGLERSTPLWYYVLKEAELVRDGVQLGPVGARIVGEVYIGLLQLDPSGFLATNPGFRPSLPSRRAGDFKIVDLLTFARVDPASRGQ